MYLIQQTKFQIEFLTPKNVIKIVLIFLLLTKGLLLLESIIFLTLKPLAPFFFVKIARKY